MFAENSFKIPKLMIMSSAYKGIYAALYAIFLLVVLSLGKCCCMSCNLVDSKCFWNFICQIHSILLYL